MQFSAGQIAAMIGGRVEGNADTEVNALAKIEEATPNAISFIANPKYEHFLYTTKAGILIVSNTLKAEKDFTATLIRVEDPYSAIAQLLAVYQKLAESVPAPGREEPSFVAATATIGSEPYIGAFSYIGENARIGSHAMIYPGVYIGPNVTIGDNVKLYPGVKIYHGCILGHNVTIHAGTVIGADGFGFAPQQDGSYAKVPQVGHVEIEDHVEIGANTTIDRATMGATRISQGVKLDNLIQVAHNVEIGAQTVIAAQTGIAGSTRIGRECMIGGQVGIIGHLNIADGTKFGAQSGVSKNIVKKNTVWQGSPARESRESLKSQVAFLQLPRLLARVQELEEKVARLLQEK